MSTNVHGIPVRNTHTPAGGARPHRAGSACTLLLSAFVISTLSGCSSDEANPTVTTSLALNADASSEGGTGSPAKDSDGDGVPDDKDLCPNTPFDYVPGIGMKRFAVNENGCRRVVHAKVCPGDTTAPNPFFLIPPAARGIWDLVWSVVARPAELTAPGGTTGWAVEVSLGGLLMEDCPVASGTLTGTIAWREKQFGGLRSTPFACPVGFRRELIPYDRTIFSAAPSLAFSGRFLHPAGGAPPCLVAIAETDTWAFSTSMERGDATISARFDAWDGNQNHLAMAFGPSPFNANGAALIKRSFGGPTEVSAFGERPAVQCAQPKLAAASAVVTAPQVATATTLANVDLVVTVPNATVVSEAGGAACAAPVLAMLTSLVVARGAESEVLVSTSTGLLPCTIERGVARCTIHRTHLRLTPGATVRAKVALLGDLGTRLLTKEVVSP